MTGFQVLPGGTTEHESALERDFVALARFRDAAAAIVSQPVTLTFNDGPRTRRYTPDFLVRWSNAPAELVEVKYRKDLHENWAQLWPGFAAARSWARERGARFRIATDRGIRGARLENIKRLLPLRTAPLDVDTARDVLAAARSLEEPTFRQLVAAVPGSRAAVLAALWRLIARGALRVELTIPIQLDTRITVT